MDVREKLVELIFDSLCRHIDKSCKLAENIADDLISNGVTVHESGCPYCCDNDEGHRMLKHSYDDEDGMEMSIHPSTRGKTDIKAKRGGQLYIFVENAEIFILKFARSAEGDLFRCKKKGRPLCRIRRKENEYGHKI